MTIRNLHLLFSPRSVALIGASDRPGSLGAVLLRNLVQGGFSGPIWPVNPRHHTLEGLTVWPDLASLPQPPDLAVICTPAASVVNLVRELGALGTRAAIVITAGLKQPWTEDCERTIEQAMLEAARPYLLRILGPNCLGVLVPGVGLNASFAPAQASAGPLAFVSQSGALATATLDWASERGIGFSHVISLGDSADIDFGDLLDYLATDAPTRAILLYIESIRHARKFMSAARAAARNKPVILVKAGRAQAGARAAASHTGALATLDAVFDAAVERSGMLRVDTLEALFDAAQTLSHLGQGRAGDLDAMARGRLAIVTNGGGAGVLAADAMAGAGGELAELQAQTLAALDACLPPTWSHGNPVDIIGDAPVSRYVQALQTVLAADEVDGVLFMHAPTAVVPAQDIAQACLPVMQQAGKPVLSCWLGGRSVVQARQLSQQAAVASHDSPERAVGAWLQLRTYARHPQALRQLVPAPMPKSLPAQDLGSARAQATAVLQQARTQGRAWLGDAASMALLRAYGIATVATRACQGIEQALDAAQAIGYPVALKVISSQVVHKSDVGGVVLNVRNARELRQSVSRMRASLAQKLPQAQFEGLTVQAMHGRAAAQELIVGMKSDPLFGPVLLLGEGGVAVELRQRHALSLPPLNAPLAQRWLDRSGVMPLLAGFRGHAPADLAALIEVLLKVSQLATDLSDIVELDLNPLLVDDSGVIAVDARVRLRPLDQAAVPPAILPYPAELEELWGQGGQTLLLRPIRPEDGTALQEFYAQASAEDLRLRFFAARREVPLSELARYSQIDYDREMTFVALPTAPGQAKRLFGQVRAVCDPDQVQAEFAIEVAGDHQGRGLGSALLRKLMAYLRQRGVKVLTGLCLTENQAMLELARSLGFALTSDTAQGQVQLRLAL